MRLSWKGVLALVALLGILSLGSALRLHQFVPPERGLPYFADVDEGIFLTEALLTWRGRVAYRDWVSSPPGSIYLYMPAALLGLPWGNPAAFMAARYFSVACGILNILLAFLLARKAGGTAAGLLAAALLALDGYAVSQDRRAMLDAPGATISALTLLVYLHSLERGPRAGLLVFLAGALSGIAFTTKAAYLVVPLALFLHLLCRRRWQDMAPFLAGAMLAFLIMGAYFLLRCPSEFIKQTYFFQFLRPRDGVMGVKARLLRMWFYSMTWLTVRVPILGLLVLLGGRLRGRGADAWSVIALWAGLVLALLLSSASYWDYYFAQLSLPLSVLGGAVLNARWQGGKGPPFPLWAQSALLLALLVLRPYRVVAQFRAALADTEVTTPAYVEVARYLARETPPQATVFTMSPVYTVLASRPLAGPEEGRFFIDSYWELTYIGMELGDKSWPQIMAMLLRRGKSHALEVIHRPPAQRWAIAIFERADYVIVDKLTRRYLTPRTLAFIKKNSEEVARVRGVLILRRRASSSGQGKPAPLAKGGKEVSASAVGK